MDGVTNDIAEIRNAAQEVARELLSFELHLGFALAEIQTWPDIEVSSLFLARLLFLWRARFPSLEGDPLVGPRRGPTAREEIVRALDQRANTLRWLAEARWSDLPSPTRLAQLFENASQEFRRSLRRMKGHSMDDERTRR
jgi:hypothetical protein